MVRDAGEDVRSQGLTPAGAASLTCSRSEAKHRSSQNRSLRAPAPGSPTPDSESL